MMKNLQDERASRPCVAFTCSMGSMVRLRTPGFTIVELLVVISIIALLASLTVGLSSVASRKSKEARLTGELAQLGTAIDSYHATLGSYPRDNAKTPAINQLYYELSGTFYQRSGRDGFFSLPNSDQRISSSVVAEFFNAPGFANSASVESGEKPKFTEEFKPDQVKQIRQGPNIDILVAPVKGPSHFTRNRIDFPLAIKAVDGTVVNPWLYDSSSATRNNRNGYDLWAEVVIGRDLIRFSNWESTPTVIGSNR